MTLYKWSQTASADATADSTINWAEGQSPSSVNDSARAMMAAIAKYRDDVTGAIVTTGTSTAYAVNTYQVFQSLSQLNGQVIAFTPHASNGAGTPNVSLNVDGLGPKTIRADPLNELSAGVLVAGTPYAAIYNGASGIFCLQNYYGNPYGVPVGGLLPYVGSTAPNSSFALPYGQTISRTTYAALFALCGTNFGAGDGFTTFNLPDLRSRTIAGKDDMGGSGSFRLTPANFGANPQAIGASGGVETKTLVAANLPPYTPSGSITNGPISISHNAIAGSTTTGGGGFPAGGNGAATISASQGTSTFSGSAQGGTSTPFSVIQPTLILSYILRVL
jgi:microcystin-dependent protein